VIGTTDTSKKVSGNGAKKLIEAGCKVNIGVLEEESRRINRRFFTFHEKRRPYITLKWAQSADGYMDVVRSQDHKAEPTWITGKPERVLVHKWRASEQAILAGAGTIRRDSPKLNVREWEGPDPLKLILSSSGSVNTSSVLNSTNSNVVVFTHNSAADLPGAVKVVLKEGISSSVQISEYLYLYGIQSLFIEGGAEVLTHFISSGLWDEARIFKGNDYFRDGVKAPLISGTLFSKTVFSGSILELYLKDGGR
jgi:diaminohydroxyphosphoribosylaminopyrimidine deaminase/5-amino-6-(5-phosphoribosylamino)uracil reductase